MARFGWLSALLSSVVFCAAVADTPAPTDTPAPEAKIPWANHHGIYSWQVINDRTVLIQAQNRKWYKATLFSPCINLPFEERLGFESNADGSFDKFSSIKTRGQNCPLVSLVESAPPGKKAGIKKNDAAAAPAAPTAPAAPAAPVAPVAPTAPTTPVQ
jgi:Family of unknown function (DUF6491)